MAVGIAHVELSLRHIRSLKEKRSVLKPLLERIRNNHNVSISEVKGMDDTSQATLGIAHISNDPQFSNRTLSKIVTTIEECRGLMVTDYTLEVL